MLCAACSSSSGGIRVGDGASVGLDAADGVALSVDGRVVMTLPASDGLVAATFTETVSGPLAIYAIERTDEVRTPLTRTGPLRREGDAVVAPYAGGDFSGTLRFEPDGPERTRVRFVPDTDSVLYDSLTVGLACDDASTFYGLGEQYNGIDHRGEAFPLLVSEQGIGRTGAPQDRPIAGDAHTTYFPMPYFVDARGFGALVETDHRVDVDLCRTDPKRARLEVVSPEPLSMRVFHGDTPAEVVRQLGDVVGRPHLPPAWAFGVWISSQGGRDAVLADVAALKAADVPFDAIWSQDWTGARMNFDGGFGVQYRWEADPELYPDLPGMIAQLHADGIRFLGYANPFVDPKLPNHFDAMAAAGLLLKNAAGEPDVFFAPNGMAAVPDLTLVASRAYVHDALYGMIDTLGMDGFMADFGEWTPLDGVPSDGSPAIVLHQRYPVLWQEVANEAARDARPDGDYAVFGRSGWTGVQGVAQIHWAGDQEVTFSPTDGLPTVVPALLSLGLSGQPFVTFDIGGFSGKGRTKELWERSTELGAFVPTMRTHEGSARQTNWQWDSDAATTAHFRRFAKIHELLRPEIVAAAEVAQRTGLPIVRPLMLMFPGDAGAADIDDEFMLGDTLLVAPVVTEGATTRRVYLPPGTWYEVFTGAAHEGGRTITVDAPMGQPPVFSLDADRPELRAVQ